MDALTLFTACALASAAPGPCGNLPPTALEHTASDVSLDRWQHYIAEASRRFGVPVSWIGAVMRLESGGHAFLGGVPIISSAGAMGLMQLMPKTYENMRAQYGLGGDPYDAHDNIMAGTAYLRAMYDRYGYPYLFAAYNAGPDRLDSYFLAGKPLPSETQHYLAMLFPHTEGSILPKTNAPKTAKNSLFFVADDSRNVSPPSPTDAQNPTISTHSMSQFLSPTTPNGQGLFVRLSAAAR
jgi:D-alanyl-D-alanine carboxypeptidase